MKALPYAVLVLAAFVLRVAYLIEWHDTALFDVLLGDGRQYDRWAREIIERGWYGREVFYQAPLYPYFMAVVYGVFGRDLWALRILQAVIGSGSCVLVALAGRRFFNARVGLLAGVLLALYAPAIFFDGLVQKGVLGGFLMGSLLFLLGEFLETRKWPWLFGAGVTLGCFALARENALVLPPIVALWLFLGFHGEPRARRAARVAILLLGIAAVLFPVGLRNRALGGRFLLTTSQAGPNFFIGNNPDANGRYTPLREGRGGPRYERQDAVELAEQTSGRRLTAAEVSDFWFERARSYIRTQPYDWIRLMAFKSWLVWHAREVMDTDSIETYRGASMLLRTLGELFHFGTLLPLGLLGIWATRLEWRRLWLLHAILLSMAGAVVLFYVLARYRYPLVPIVALFAAVGLLEIVRLVRARNWRPLGTVCLILIVPALVFNWSFADRLDPRTITYYNLGSALLEEGRIEEGRTRFERALELDPDFVEARVKLGDALTRSSRPDLALPHLRRAMSEDPGNADAHTVLGTAQLQLGKTDEAVEYFRSAILIDPASGAAHNNLALILAGRGEFAQAISHWERAIPATPDDPSLYRNLAKVLLHIGQPKRAVEQLERGIERVPEDPELRQLLDAARQHP